VEVIDVEVVLVNPALRNLQMPAVIFFVADSRHDARRFPGFQDDGNLIRFSFLQIGLYEFITSARGSVQDGCAPLLGPVLHPVPKLISDLGQHLTTDRVLLTVGGEEANHSLGLLKRLNQAIQQNSVKATVVESNATLVVLVKGVHETLQCD
jgi:hypothetical protein